MNIHTRLTDLLVTGGSHVSHAILLDRSRPSKHFWARARIGLWRGVRDRFSTVSTTVHHTLNAVARVKSVIMLQHDHRSRSLCNRIYYGARTHVPLVGTCTGGSPTSRARESARARKLALTLKSSKTPNTHTFCPPVEGHA